MMFVRFDSAATSLVLPSARAIAVTFRRSISPTGGLGIHPYHMFSIALVKSITLDILAIVVGLFLLFRLAHMAFNWPRRGFAWEDQRGSVVMEFVLLTPLLLAVLLVIFQIALMVQAKLIVNYAAFCAVRSAIVVIPANVRSKRSDKRDEDANQIDLRDPESPKMEIIRRAAALACGGVSPPLNASLALKTGTVPSLGEIAPLEEVALVFFASDVSRQFVGRASYALAPNNTKVEITLEPHHDQRPDSTNYSLVTVKVTHRYYLTVPFAERLFGTRFGGSGWLFGAAYYITITEQYTLPSEDDLIFPDSERPVVEQDQAGGIQ